MQNENIIITRNNIGQWASFIGGGGLLIGIIGLIWQGGLTTVIAGALAVGAAGIAAWALMLPEEFKGFISGRQVRRGTAAVFASLLLIGIVALVYILLQRATLTLDMTESLRFSISDETRAVLRRITRPIQITGFYSSASLRVREIDDQIFRLYEAETGGLIRRRYIDPDEQPGMRNAFNVLEDSSVYVSFLTPEGTVDFDTVARVPRTDSQERDMTGAIARLLAAGQLKVYFEIGHSELDPYDTGQQGLSGISNGMRESGLVTDIISLVDMANAGSRIPDDASAIILARPTTDLSAPEIAILDDYLKRGGALFILADALFNPDAFLRQDGLFNQYLWQSYGLRALDAVVVDPASSSQTALDIISAAVFTATDIGARLDSENSPTLFSVARAIEVNDDPPANVGNGRVIMSSPQSYGETNLQALAETNTYTFDQGVDLAGPLTTVAWATNTELGSRIVLIGDGDFVTNGRITVGGNSILFTDSISWLSGYGEAVDFAPQVFSTGLPLILVTGQTLDLIAFVTVILIPGMVLIIGLAVWTRRQRQA